MSNILQTLFNTNHDQPSFLVFVILAVIALVVPNAAKYLHDSRQVRNKPHTASDSPARPAKPKKRRKKKR